MFCPCWPRPPAPKYQDYIIVQVVDKPIASPTPTNTPTNANARIAEVAQKRFIFIYGGR